MTRVQALGKEIQALSQTELTELRDWFAAFDASEWDRQIEEDVQSGKLDRLAQRALAAHQRGESRELGNISPRRILGL